MQELHEGAHAFCLFTSLVYPAVHPGTRLLPLKAAHLGTALRTIAHAGTQLTDLRCDSGMGAPAVAIKLAFATISSTQPPPEHTTSINSCSSITSILQWIQYPAGAGSLYRVSTFHR